MTPVRSDWNYGNAHFLRGVAWELRARGADVRILEPADAWSARCLIADHGPDALTAYEQRSLAGSIRGAATVESPVADAKSLE